mgnify:CR=1 FL=1
MRAANETTLDETFQDGPAALSEATHRVGHEMVDRYGRHDFDIRLSLPWFKNRYYLRVLSGTEQRSPQRLDAEKQSGIAKISIFYGIVLFLFFASAIFGAAIFLYIVKSMLGINLFEAHSPFHRIFF